MRIRCRLPYTSQWKVKRELRTTIDRVFFLRHLNYMLLYGDVNWRLVADRRAYHRRRSVRTQHLRATTLFLSQNLERAKIGWGAARPRGLHAGPVDAAAGARSGVAPGSVIAVCAPPSLKSDELSHGRQS
jgi:hypothetical protein